ncbi:MAG: ArsR/SmtB family transcription factor [Gaiellaceae bacterium]
MMVQVSNTSGDARASSAPVSNSGASLGGYSSTLARLLSPQLFRALSDPTRVSLFLRLTEQREPCTVGQIAQGSGVDLSVVSRHLSILREAGLIRCEKQGKEVWCTVETAAITEILRDLADALEACCSKGDCGSAVSAPEMTAARRPTPSRT